MSPFEAVKTVQPVNISTFYALRWHGEEKDGEALEWMAGQYGWIIMPSSPFARDDSSLRLIGRNRKRYSVKPGEWIIALGPNGSLRVCSDKQYKTDYKETEDVQ